MAAKEDLAEELAQQIRAAIAGASPPATPARPAVLESTDLEDVRIPIRRAEEHLTPTIPQAARFARAKSLVLRALRFLWRDQASFNALALEAANGVVAALERNRAEQERRSAELEEDFRRRDAAEDRRHDHGGHRKADDVPVDREIK